jgi:hypothetical protein
MSPMSDPVVMTGLGILGIPPLPDLRTLDEHIAALDSAAAYHRQVGAASTRAARSASGNEGPAATAVRQAHNAVLAHAGDLADRLELTAHGLHITKQVIEWIERLLATAAVLAAATIALWPEMIPRIAGMARRFLDMLAEAMRGIGRLFDRLIDGRSERKLVEDLSSDRHDIWRFGRRPTGDGFDPRPKPTTDKKWIRAHGTSEVDIANTRFPELPKDRQDETRASMKPAVQLVREAQRSGRDVENAEFVEEAAAKIHIAWLKRNSANATNVQKLPYAELPEGEKKQDRGFVLYAVHALT